MTSLLNDLDLPTVLAVLAVFNGLFALVWLLLSELWRMAPWSCRAMALSQFVSALGMVLASPRLSVPAPWREAGLDGVALLGMGLVILALRRAHRLRRRWRDVAALSWGGALAVALAQALGWRDLAQGLALGGLALLAWQGFRAAREGPDPRPPALVALPLLLPFAGLLLLSLCRAAVWLAGAEPGRGFGTGEVSMLGAILVLWSLLAFAGMSLVNLLVWRLLSRARNLLRRDSLTGALNRRAFQAEVIEAQAHLQRDMRFAFVVADVDHFKRINDTLGHAGGDAALRHCVEVWRGCLRDLDQLGRLGGEEFGVLLWGADLATAETVAERMRERLHRTPLRWAGQAVTLSASFGVALPRTHDAEGESGLARADAQLYRAKAQGRNQVCVAHDAPQEAP